MVRKDQNGLYTVLVQVSDGSIPNSDISELRIRVPSLHRSIIFDECFEHHFEMQARGFAQPTYFVPNRNFKLRSK